MNALIARVLVVENASNWRMYLQATLESLGCQVYTAETLEQGMEALNQGPYGLAIVDVRLAEGYPSDVSGLSIIKEAWTKRVIPHFIVLSGYPVETEVRSELNEVPYQILDKASVTKRHFQDTIRKLIGEVR